MKFDNKTITLRKDGRWWARYYDNGVQKSVYGRTQRDCYNNLKYALAKRPKQKRAPRERQAPAKFTLFSWLDFWNETYKKPINRSDTISMQIRVHIKPNARNRMLEKVTTLDLIDILNSIDENKAKTRIDVRNILYGAFEQACINRMLPYNPAKGLPKISYKQEKGHALTRTEEEQFLKDIKRSTYEKLFIFYILTGVRRNEATELKVEHVDWHARIIHVPGTKTKNAARTIPLFEAVAELLKSITPKDGRYFPFDGMNVTHAFKKLCPEHKLHDLRHTFATRCLENGINIKTVQAWLGHSDFKTTANIYSDVQTEFVTEQAKLLDNYYKKRF